jgi:hypothetical protein
MSKVILDAELKAKFPKLDEPMEFCDVSGLTLGRYVQPFQHESSCSKSFSNRCVE